MVSVLDELKNHHDSFAKLLGILRDELDSLNCEGIADFTLMRDCMVYMTGFADRFHHPKEDLVFQCVAEAMPESKATADALLCEHDDILTTGRELLRALNVAVNTSDAPANDIESHGWRYVAAMYQHMVDEENGLYLIAEQALTPTDWIRIGLASGDSTRDPIFGTVVTDEFARIYASVNQRTAWKLAS